ncbi:MAG: amino acid ABC transporter ATP-binding protein [Acidobacteria bacterium]|nr:amino acid ABC transporter ATP-binding protein [Acidobacteriota bacterium]
MTTLEVRDVAIKRGGRAVIEGVSFSAARGELLAVVGVSGSGKTTVLRAIAGLDPIAAGAIDVGGVRLTPGRAPRGQTRRDLHRSIGIVFQFHHLFSHMNALDNVSLAPIHVLRRQRADAARRARELLDRLGVGGRAEAMPQDLSGGEAQRVAIARALAVDPPVLLMDEPTASLDRARRDGLARTLMQLAALGRTVVVATHDVAFASACAHRAVILDGGRVAREGVPAEVLRDAS